MKNAYQTIKIRSSVPTIQRLVLDGKFQNNIVLTKMDTDG